MTVETTLQEMFDEYPDLFATREECFHHLFCTNGNGYIWRWGQLMDCKYYDEFKNEHEQDYLNPAVARAKQSEENIAKKRQEDRELWDLHRENDLEDGLPDIGPYDPKTNWLSSLSRHSNLFNVPEDVKPDWKMAVEECKEMMSKDGIDIEHFFSSISAITH